MRVMVHVSDRSFDEHSADVKAKIAMATQSTHSGPT